jgi:hypothetical protein
MLFQAVIGFIWNPSSLASVEAGPAPPPSLVQHSQDALPYAGMTPPPSSCTSPDHGGELNRTPPQCCLGKNNMVVMQWSDNNYTADRGQQQHNRACRDVAVESSAVDQCDWLRTPGWQVLLCIRFVMSDCQCYSRSRLSGD